MNGHDGSIEQGGEPEGAEASASQRPPQLGGAKYLDAITAIFITALLVSNVIASKTAVLFGYTIGVGIFVFPISYIFGDVLTEVYGYKRSRRVIWLGFGSVGVASLIFFLTDIAPAAPTYQHQDAFHTILGQSPFILLASVLAYFCGEFCNSYVMAKMKVWTEGEHLWARTIGSTVVGEGVDSLIFYPLAFALFPMLFGMTEAVWATGMLVAVMVNNYFLKVIIEALATPLTYGVVGWLKRAEGLDVYDRDTDFNPFLFDDRQSAGA